MKFLPKEPIMMLDATEDDIMVEQLNDSANPKPRQQDATSSFGMFLQDNVSLSTTTEQLETLIASLKDVPEINEARVAYFKAEIKSGNYKINNNKIAMKLLNDAEVA